MINDTADIPEEQLKVLEGIEFPGKINVSDEVLLANVRSSIRRGHPQIRPQMPNYDRVVLVGGGPSLLQTEDELIELVKEGAKLVTVNGAYHWCLERNLFPKTQIVMDARASNARFVEPYVPGCRYVLASQCAPETWDAVAERPEVWIWHAAVGATGELKDLLDTYYADNWLGIGGGITVISRAIGLLRAVGYIRFDLFGVDCCFMDGIHHAYDQVENEQDQAFAFYVYPSGHPELQRVFQCAPWHAKQFECLLQVVKVNGEHFLLNVHGDGLFAFALKAGASLVCTDQKGVSDVSTSI
jgi:hypothetical protein